MLIKGIMGKKEFAAVWRKFESRNTKQNTMTEIQNLKTKVLIEKK
jgi:hypothetical protein